MAAVKSSSPAIHFRDEGSGRGIPFVFIHGWACDSSAWRPQVEDLKADHRCISVDLRGRGESVAVAPYDVFTAAADVAAVIRSLGLPPVIAVGHSLGGIVALCLNQADPDLVTGIVTGDSPLELDAPRRWPRTAAALREASSMEPVEAFIEGFFIESTSEALAADVRALMLTCDPEVAAGMLENGERVADALPDLIRLADAKPFMAFWAEKPLGEPNLLRDLATFVRQEPIAGAGHFFQLERPEITNALLRAFEDDVLTDPRLKPRLDA